MSPFVIDLSLSDNDIFKLFKSYVDENIQTNKSREYFKEQFEKTILLRLSGMRKLRENGSNAELSKTFKHETEVIVVTLNTVPSSFGRRIKKFLGG